MVQRLHPAITILVALAPAALALWWGRGVSRHLDDPLLPERLFANRRRTGPVFGAAVGVLFVTAIDHLAWALPLLVLARMAAAYPLRKALHNETWSFFTYLSFFTRLMAAGFGLWILLAMMPYLATAAGARDGILAAALAAIVVAWHRRYSTVFRWMLRTRPVDDPEIVARFGQMLKHCGLPSVSLEQVDLRGGVFANGVALASIRRPAVVITDTLITRLDRDETMAILAHELAHLEFYNPSRLRRNSAVVYALVTIGALLDPVVRVIAPQTLDAAPLLWPVVLLAVGLLRVQHRQKHETESDLRAVELTGDAESVVRALTKLHAFARLPRRWDSEFERHATHPSLARRIQAIRAAAGTAQTAISESVTFAAPQGAASVTFHDDRLEWRQSPSTSRAIDYGQLAELRIDTRAAGAPRLVAVDSTNQRLEIALNPGDVVRAQSVLDIVDTRLGRAGVAPVVPLRIGRVLTLLAIFSALAVSQMSVVIAGLLAFVRPSSQLAAATGASAVTAAVLTWRDHGFWSSGDSPSWVATTLILSGAALIGVAFANRVETLPRAVPKLVVLLASCAALAWMVLPMHGFGALELRRSALEWPGVSILTLGLAGALAFTRSPRARWAAVPVALAGVFAGFLGSAAFVERFVNDPFVSPAPAVAVTTLTGPPLTEFSVAFDASKLWISRTGLYVALRTEDEDEHSTIRAGRVGGPLADFAADDAGFLDESRLFLLTHQTGVSALRVVDLSADNRETWSVRVPLSWAALSFDRPAERWRLFGWDSTQNIASAEGHVGDSAVSETQWTSPANDIDDMEAVAVSHGVALAIESHPSARAPGLLSRWLAFLPTGDRTESQLWALDAHAPVEIASSRIPLNCRSSVVMDRPAMCASFDGGITRFFAVDPASRQFTALASVSGRVLVRDRGDRDWVFGWWDHQLTAFAPTLRQAIRVAPADGARPSHLAVGDAVVASVSSRGDRSTIRVHAIPPQ